MTRRFAILGIALESNAFAPVATEQDFHGRLYLEGDDIVSEARKPTGRIAMEVSGFVRTMDAIGAWQPIPILYTECEPAGPIETGFFNNIIERLTQALSTLDSLDGVYIANHGAMTAEHLSDPDGVIFETVRSIVGDRVPIVATLDLHANISDRMADASDVIIGYQTNPHVDMFERGEEAARVLVNLEAGVGAEQVLIRLPLTPASVTLLTQSGPYADLIDYGQRRKREYAGQIINVSVFGGFVFSDTPENGLAVVVSAKSSSEVAYTLASEIAERAWRNRAQFKKELTSIAAAVNLAEASPKGNTGAVLFSDAGDNPGGGGSGNTTALLRALIESDAERVLYGSMFDPALASEAHELGVGATFDASFNREAHYEQAEAFTVTAKVVALSDGRIIGRRGIYAQRELNLGLSCALSIGPNHQVTVIVISHRIQTADPVFFEQFNLDISEANTVCVKSRGHFRAGFDLWFQPHQVYEIDTPGLTSPVLSRLTWRGLPRPCYPLDEDTNWSASPHVQRFEQ